MSTLNVVCIRQLNWSSNSNRLTLNYLSNSKPPEIPSTRNLQVSQKTSGSYNEARNASADSGQSSSPGASSSNVSLADSLEDQTSGGQHQVVRSNAGTIAALQEPQKGDKLSKSELDYDDVQTIKNYQKAATLASKTVSTNNNNNDTIKATTPTDANQEATAVPGGPEANAVMATKQQPPAKLPLSSNNNLGSPPNSNDKPEQQGDNIMKQQQQKSVSGNMNNNYSGLNLNMTAAEMRELIARRKKFDPKKAQMNIRQKYEIIQQM